MKTSNTPAGMLTDALKIHTKEAHLSVERLIIKKIQSLRTMQDYIDLLKIFYGYFSSLEERIARFLNTKKLPDYADRRKTTALLDDLNSAGKTQSIQQTASDLPAIESHAQALGALYVIEGSTLGGQIISKMLREKLGDRSPTKYNFFEGYGDNTQEKWDLFKTTLNDPSHSEKDIILTLSAALETFEKFKQWIERHDSNEKL